MRRRLFLERKIISLAFWRKTHVMNVKKRLTGYDSEKFSETAVLFEITTRKSKILLWH